MINHNVEQCKFSIGNGADEAVLQYKLEDNKVNFTRTYVPESLRGQGVAKQLVDAGLAWAKAQQLLISADCHYVQKFF
ncbi:GNAT family N-acetyltransferase [Paraferrimonas sp. SM1919]|uniref:GNAT family N-acetyltransferase n=1 Tax=Paraferrimonas sp. SM1919 TaxID=2662263 RepID=UPI0013D1EAAC|nr:GNAT family N-acetyltransferase [Paraferrimonas sp. SM1919]